MSIKHVHQNKKDLQLSDTTGTIFNNQWHSIGVDGTIDNSFHIQRSFFLIRQSFYWKKDTSSHWVFSRIRVVQSLVFCVLLCRSLFDPLTFFLYSLSFYDFRFLINPLVSSSFFLKYYDTNNISFSCQSITFRSVLYSTALSAFNVHTYLRDQRYSNFFTEN